MVGHLTREYSRIAWYFLARGGSISVEASSHRRHCKQLCGRMEIKFPCWVAFTCSRMATLNWLKALLKVVIYANLRHGVQMFSQISRIPDLIRKFWAKKCGLYAGVYGMGLLIDYTWNLWCEGGKGGIVRPFLQTKWTKFLCHILLITLSESVFRNFINHICLLTAFHASYSNFSLSTGHT